MSRHSYLWHASCPAVFNNGIGFMSAYLACVTGSTLQFNMSQLVPLAAPPVTPMLPVLLATSIVE